VPERPSRWADCPRGLGDAETGNVASLERQYENSRVAATLCAAEIRSNFWKINVQNESKKLEITNAIFEQVNEAFPEQIAEEKTATLCGVLSKLCPGDLARRRSMRAQNQELA